MQITPLLAVISLLGAVNAKINQYASMDECHQDKNNLKHTTGKETVFEPSTQVVFTSETLVAYDKNDGSKCQGDGLGTFPKGHCTDINTAFESWKVTCSRGLIPVSRIVYGG
ncbi:hypothetical protein F5B20DRAFT_579322 [Whalleya microplaca]|nr:hypothetical protein F5B20DRAFT_579322 [Whalleya microplaca]